MRPALIRSCCLAVTALALTITALVGAPSARAAEPSANVSGAHKLLVVAVRFPGVRPSKTLGEIRQKVVRVERYIRAASYDKAWLETRLVGWYDMPAPLKSYRVSPHNFTVDRGRVRRLVADALGAARRDADLNAFDSVWIVVGAWTTPGKGYGMIAYAANPGMLTGVRGARSGFEKVGLAGGGTYAGPAIVCAENAHPGHAAHDLLHALGGVVDSKRVVPDLYDFEVQSSVRAEKLADFPQALHAGPWDIMSRHFMRKKLPPILPSSFTRLRLGWIGDDQLATIRPGETREVTLGPLAGGRGTLAVRIPLDQHRYLLLENRQAVRADSILPAHGLLVLKVDTTLDEGAGIVKAVDANPSTKTLNDAPFKAGAGKDRAYLDKKAGIAVAPLALESDKSLRVLVTTPQGLSGSGG